MSVYTLINESELVQILRAYALGSLDAYVGVNGGVTNTIYKIEVGRRTYILTLFEELSAAELPFYLDLMDFLAQADYPCPRVIADTTANPIQHFAGKPLVLMDFLSGTEVTQPLPIHCAAVGAALGQLHHLTNTYPQVQADTRGEAWRQQMVQRLLPRLAVADQRLLTEAQQLAQSVQALNLPRGIIHADLFPDNVLFTGTQLTGVLDFYYACQGFYLYDLAITLNAWCLDDKGCLDAERCQALITAYQQQRQLTMLERQTLSAMLTLAALRFWLSRLYDKQLHASSDQIQVKDPDEYKTILLNHQLKKGHALLSDERLSLFD